MIKIKDKRWLKENIKVAEKKPVASNAKQESIQESVLKEYNLIIMDYKKIIEDLMLQINKKNYIKKEIMVKRGSDDKIVSVGNVVVNRDKKGKIKSLTIGDESE